MPTTQDHKMDDFGIGIAKTVAAPIAANLPEFSQQSFINSMRESATGGWVSRISSALQVHLPDDFPDAIKILLQSIGPELPPEETMPDAHALTPIVHYIVLSGINHFELSMNAFSALCKRTYMAHAGVRHFVIEFPDRTMSKLSEWVNDNSPHVRRMVVNGTRPRLRYGAMPGPTMLQCFRDDPEPVLNLLDNLRDDGSRTVRRAVGGSISDIAKDNRDLAYDRLEQWLRHGSKETRQIACQALRYGLRKGDSRAMELLEQAKRH